MPMTHPSHFCIRYHIVITIFLTNGEEQRFIIRFHIPASPKKHALKDIIEIVLALRVISHALASMVYFHGIFLLEVHEHRSE